jgi:hypothetical protein
MVQLDPMQAAATVVPNTVGLLHKVLTSHCSSSVVCEMPMVKRYLVQASPRNAADPDQMQWQVAGDFVSMADYQAYAQAPVHFAIRKDFSENTTRVTFLDVAV